MHMDRYIPLITSSGEPFERGLQLGRLAQERVLHSVAAYMQIFKHISGLSRDEVFAQAERFLPSIAAFAPHLLEEMRGIAEGAECHLYEIIAINARTELMYGLTHQPECTALAVGPAASADGHTRLGQNWDWHPSLTGALVLWTIKREDGPDLLTLTEAGIVGKIGINAAGLAMCVNLLKSDSDSAGPAVPMHVILRRLLEEACTVEEACTLLERTARCTSCNHLLADGSGAIAAVEATPAAQGVLRAPHGVLTHTNHCLEPELFAQDRNAREYPETLARHERMQALVTGERVDGQGLRRMLADHATAPHSICLHTQSSWAFPEQGESIASVIFDVTAGTLDLADGPPCQHAYRRHRVSELFRGR
jgi:isopenicillin-N N-acyltransferase-like protein